MKKNTNLVHVKQEKKVSPLQKQFNIRIQKIEKVKKQIVDLEEKNQAVQGQVVEHIHPVTARLVEVQKELVYFLDEAMEFKLAKGVKEGIENSILEICSELIFKECQRDMIPLFDKYSEQSFKQLEEQHLGSFKEEMKQHFSEQMDMDIDFDDIEIDLLDPQSFFRNFQEKMQQDPEFQKLLEENEKLQKEQKQELKNISQATKKIYISLVTEFHPDKETDELKKLEKTEIVKKITQAYQEDDLFELLRLKTELQTHENADLQHLPEEQLKYYNQILSDQLRELQMKLYSFKNHFDPMITQLLRSKTIVTMEKNVLKMKKEVESTVYQIESDLRYLRQSNKNINQFFKPIKQDDMFKNLMKLLSDME